MTYGPVTEWPIFTLANSYTILFKSIELSICVKYRSMYILVNNFF